MTEIYLEHEDQKHPLPAAAPLTVGSGAPCGLRLQAAGVEEEHAVVRLDGNRVVLQSKVPGEHDVRVNGVAAHAAPLEAGDAVQFGNLETTFEMSDEGATLRLEGASHPLVRGVNAIGRDPGSGVVLDDESVSRKHAAIFILPSGQVVLRDLGSANGTIVKGRRLGEIEVRAGDEVRVGDAVLHLRRQDAPAQPAQPAQPAADMAGGAAAKTVVGGRPPAAATPAGDGPPATPKLELELDGAKRPLQEGTLRIGRAPDCELVIDDDARVSRHHAELRVSGGQAVLRDLGSSNGTRVNGATISGERPLQDGDRIGIGGQELTFSADVPVTPYGQTVVARELPGAGGRTAMAPAAGRAPASGGAGIVPTDRESALLALDLATDAGEDQIRRRYRELYSEFQIRLTNAPTQDLKATYERRLNELRGAAEILLPQAAGGTRDLPALEPVEARPDAVATAAGTEPGTLPSSGPSSPPESAVSPAVAAAAATKDGGAKKAIPRSTLIMAVVSALLLGAVIFAALGSLRATRATAALQSERDAKQEEVAQVEAAIPQTTKAVEALTQTKGAMLANAELKICNHSSRPLEWVWLNTAWFDEEAGDFRRFDTGLDTDYEYLTYERIEPGATFAGGQWVVGEQRIWPGQAIFFSALFVYDNRDVLRAAATPDLEGGCFPLNLDR